MDHAPKAPDNPENPTPTDSVPGALPAEIEVDHLVPVRFIVDLGAERILRVLVRDTAVYPLGSCRVQGHPYDGPGAAEAVAIAAEADWRGWRALMMPCEHCGRGVEWPEFLQADQGPHLEEGAVRKVWLEYELPLLCVVDVAREKVVDVVVWDEHIWVSGCQPVAWAPASPGAPLSEAEIEAAEELVAAEESPQWELSLAYCLRCGRGRRLHGEPAPNEEELLARLPASPPWDLQQ